MRLRFSKYHGTGNDFILVNNMDGRIAMEAERISQLCNRHFGIGSDGLILLEESSEADFHMNFYNPDASRSFCGNGSRCAVHFAHALGLVGKECTFTAIDGGHEANLVGGDIHIHMRDVQGVEESGEGLFIHTGSPHLIIYLPGIEEIDLCREARAIRYSDRYRAEGVNVNYVEDRGDHLYMRTYERGVEDETLSCGTGVTAVALSFGWKNPALEHVSIGTRGGRLSVDFKNHGGGKFNHIWLKGPAREVFTGEVEV